MVNRYHCSEGCAGRRPGLRRLANLIDLVCGLQWMVGGAADSIVGQYQPMLWSRTS